MSTQPLNVLSWLCSRRGDVVTAIRALTRGRAWTTDELATLVQRLQAFDTLIKHEETRTLRVPRPRPPDHTPWRKIRFTIPVDDVLPIPISDADDAQDGVVHVIQADIDRRANRIVSRAYATIGRRRTRRYEGYHS